MGAFWNLGEFSDCYLSQPWQLVTISGPGILVLERSGGM